MLFPPALIVYFYLSGYQKLGKEYGQLIAWFLFSSSLKELRYRKRKLGKIRNLFPLSSLALPSLILAAGDTLEAKNITQYMQGYTVPEHCTSPEVPPFHTPDIKKLQLPPFACGAAEGQSTSSSCPTKQGKKDTFKHRNFKSVEVSFPCEKK